MSCQCRLLIVFEKDFTDKSVTPDILLHGIVVCASSNAGKLFLNGNRHASREQAATTNVHKCWNEFGFFLAFVPFWLSGPSTFILSSIETLAMSCVE